MVYIYIYHDVQCNGGMAKCVTAVPLMVLY